MFVIYVESRNKELYFHVDNDIVVAAVPGTPEDGIEYSPPLIWNTRNRPLYEFIQPDELNVTIAPVVDDSDTFSNPTVWDVFNRNLYNPDGQDELPVALADDVWLQFKQQTSSPFRQIIPTDDESIGFTPPVTIVDDDIWFHPTRQSGKPLALPIEDEGGFNQVLLIYDDTESVWPYLNKKKVKLTLYLM